MEAAHLPFRRSSGVPTLDVVLETRTLRETAHTSLRQLTKSGSSPVFSSRCGKARGGEVGSQVVVCGTSRQWSEAALRAFRTFKANDLTARAPISGVGARRSDAERASGRWAASGLR